MSRWFRMYDEILDDPKVQKLSAADFKSWVNLLCLASKNGGKLPAIDDIAFALRETVDAVSTVLERLLNGGLIERRSGGSDGAHYAPNKWDERQYKSDTSTNRVKRFRERFKPVAETPPDTESEADTEQKEQGGGKSPTSYAFFGRTIRLKPNDLQRWRATFSAIPDIMAELTALDAWFETQDEAKRRNWFHTTAGSLNRKHQENLSAKADRDSGEDGWAMMP